MKVFIEMFASFLDALWGFVFVGLFLAVLWLVLNNLVKP